MIELYLAKVKSKVITENIIETNDSFILTKYDKSELIVYDWLLKKLKKVGLNTEPTMPFYLPHEIYNLKYKNNCYHIFEQDSDGRSLLQIDLENIMIAGKLDSSHSNDVYSLIYLSQKENVLRKIDLKKFNL